MKNKKLLLIVSIVLAMTMSLGGTLAYLTDTDGEVNVMTVGNVIIDLIEQQRNEEGTALEDFEQGKPMIPIVGSAQAAADGSNMDKFGMTTAANYVDKIVSVKNTGTSDAWVRVLVAVPASLEETDNAAGPLHWNLGNRVALNGDYNHQNVPAYNWVVTDAETIKIGEVDYNVYCFYYKDVLTKNAQTTAAVAGFYLDSMVDYDADNGYYTFNGEEIEGFEGTVVVPVLAQAVQASGFETDDTSAGYIKAFNASFPYTETTENDKLSSWFNEGEMAEAVPAVVSVKNVTELQNALDAATKGTTIINLAADITGDVTVTQKPDVKIVIDGNNHSYAGVILVDGQSKRYETAGLTIKNINFVADSLSEDAYINLGNGNTNTRYTNNVTVSNCTFDYNGEDDKVAIKSYTGGDWNLTVNDCNASAKMHSLLQVTNVEKGLTVNGCKVYSKNGINLNNTPYLSMSGCTFDTTGYCVRFGVSGNTLNGDFSITNSTLTSANDDGDAVIIFRGNADGSTLDLTGTTLVGDPWYTGANNVTIIK